MALLQIYNGDEGWGHCEKLSRPLDLLWELSNPYWAGNSQGDDMGGGDVSVCVCGGGGGGGVSGGGGG